MGFVSRRLPFSANILADVHSCRAFLLKREEAEDISISANTFCFPKAVREVIRTPDLPLRSGTVVLEALIFWAFPSGTHFCTHFAPTFFVESIGFKFLC